AQRGAATLRRQRLRLALDLGVLEHLAPARQPCSSGEAERISVHGELVCALPVPPLSATHGSASAQRPQPPAGSQLRLRRNSGQRADLAEQRDSVPVTPAFGEPPFLVEAIDRDPA